MSISGVIPRAGLGALESFRDEIDRPGRNVRDPKEIEPLGGRPLAHDGIEQRRQVGPVRQPRREVVVLRLVRQVAPTDDLAEGPPEPVGEWRHHDVPVVLCLERIVGVDGLVPRAKPARYHPQVQIGDAHIAEHVDRQIEH